MLLTITTTHQPATDLGYLLHKNPHGAPARSTWRSGGRTSSIRRPRPSAARPRCCWRSIRWGSVRGRRGRRRAVRARAVRQRPALRRLFASQRGHLAGLGLGAVRPLPRPAGAGRDSACRLSPGCSVLPCRGGEAFLAEAVRAAGLRGRRRRGCRWMSGSRSGARARTSPSS